MEHHENQTAPAPATLVAASRSPVFTYGVAVLMTGLTLLARLGLSPWIGDGRPLLIIFFVPILLSAYLGGLGPGLVATALAALGADYYLIPVIHSFSFERPVDFVQWVLLVVCGALASALRVSLNNPFFRIGVRCTELLAGSRKIC